MKRSSAGIILFTFVLIPFMLGNSRCRRTEPETPEKKGIEADGYKEESKKLTFILDTVASGFEIPWGMAFPDAQTLLVSDKNGELIRCNLENGEQTVLSGLPNIEQLGQGGLLDISLHPDYANNGWLYLAHAASANGGIGTTISRAKIQGDQLVSLETVFQCDPGKTGGAHFGCRMVWIDGYLYFTLGERYQKEEAQKLNVHLGKVIRIREDGSTPPDNPFAGQPDTKGEIWSYGHRNGQGLYYDKETGILWEHEHGPKGGDELNIIEKGKNYGWPLITFGVDYDGSIISEDTARDGMEQPRHYWVPSIAPSGLTRVKGSVYPEWKNDFFIGGLASQGLFRLSMNAGNKVQEEEKMLDGFFRIRNVVSGPDGYLYIASESPGIIFRLVPVR